MTLDHLSLWSRFDRRDWASWIFKFGFCEKDRCCLSNVFLRAKSQTPDHEALCRVMKSRIVDDRSARDLVWSFLRRDMHGWNWKYVSSLKVQLLFHLFLSRGKKWDIDAYAANTVRKVNNESSAVYHSIFLRQTYGNDLRFRIPLIDFQINSGFKCIVLLVNWKSQ